MFYQFSAYGFLKNLRFFEPFILLIFRSYGLSFFQIGLLYSIRDIAANVLEIPTGIVADSFGRRRAMVSAFISYIISFLMFFFLSDFGFLAMAMIIFAVGEAFRSGTHKALILSYLQQMGISQLKVAYYGLTRSASQLGSAANALIAAGLVFYTGNYRLMFLAAIIPYALDLMNLISYPKSLDEKLQRTSGKEFLVRLKNTLEEFFRLFSRGSAILALLNSSSFSGVFKSVKDYLQPVLVTLTISMTLFMDLEKTQKEALVIGLIYFGIYLLTSQASRWAYLISNRFSNLPAAMNTTYLIGTSVLLFAGLSSQWNASILAVVCFILLFLVINIRRPINVGVISDQISSSVMASGLSTEAQLTTIFSAGFAPLLGFLADSFGVGYGIALVGLLMLCLYGFVRVR
jgi:MFS family permease